MASPAPSVTSLAAPFFLGCIFNAFFYGILVVQTYFYYLSFPHDGRIIQGLVYGIFLLETFQIFLSEYDGFMKYVANFANVPVLDEVRMTWLSSPTLCGIVGCIVQLWFVYRIYVLSKSIFVCIPIALTSLTQCAGAMATGILGHKVQHFSLFGASLEVTCTVWLTSSAVCDVLIASAMTAYLYRRKSLFHETNVIISRLIRITVETGSATAVLAIVDLILFLGFRHRTYFDAPSTVLAKAYSNSFMAILNSRMHGHFNSDSSMSKTQQSGLVFEPISADARRTGRGETTHAPAPVVIHITREALDDEEHPLGTLSNKAYHGTPPSRAAHF